MRLLLSTNRDGGSRPSETATRCYLDKVDNLVLGGILLLAWVALGRYDSPAQSHSQSQSTHALGVEMVRVSTPEAIEPPAFDPSQELRVPVSTISAGDFRQPAVLRARGPWAFGAAEIENVASRLGEPVDRGAAYLLYDFPSARARLALLFNGGLLDTIVLEPTAADWGLPPSRDLQRREPAPDDQNCSFFTTPNSAVFYLACPSDGPSVSAVYIQTVTKEVLNPSSLRRIAPPAERPHAGQLDPSGRDRLSSHFQRSLRLKETALGTDHSSTHFLRFEIARIAYQSGQPSDGRTRMRAAADALRPALGHGHPDLAALGAWANPSSSVR